MSESINATCSCGKEYHLSAEEAGNRIRCKECGEEILLPEQAPAPDDFLPQDGFVTRDPEELMGEINTSIITKGVVVSLLIHLIVVGLTSFGLYADWAEYGFMLPVEIKAEKKRIADEERKEKLAAARKKKEEERKAAIAAKEEAAKKKAANTKSAKPADSKAGDTEDGKDNRSDYQKKVEEVRTDKPGQDLDSDVGLED
jgi:DNA-directed RNA polymerase subunit RPC12/RpoP